MLTLLFPLCFFSIVGVLPCLSFCVFSDGKGAGGWNRTNRNGFLLPGKSSHSRAPGAIVVPCSRRAARKGRPSLRSHSPELPWARSFWLPVKCARLSVGAGYSYLFIVVMSIVKVEGRFLPYWVKFTFMHPLVSARS